MCIRDSGNVYRADIPVIFISPDFLQELFSGKNLILPLRQITQKFKFPESEFQNFSVFADFIAIQIDR